MLDWQECRPGELNYNNTLLSLQQTGVDGLYPALRGVAECGLELWLAALAILSPKNPPLCALYWEIRLHKIIPCKPFFFFLFLIACNVVLKV